MANNLLLPVTLSQNCSAHTPGVQAGAGHGLNLTPICMRSIFSTDRSRQAALAVRGETARCSEIGGAPLSKAEKRKQTAVCDR